MLVNVMRKPRDTSPNIKVFHEIGSTNELMTSPIVSATTRERPRPKGSLCIHVSHSEHCLAMAGTRWESGKHLLISYNCAQVAIASASSALYSVIRCSTSRCTVRMQKTMTYKKTRTRDRLKRNCTYPSNRYGTSDFGAGAVGILNV